MIKLLFTLLNKKEKKKIPYIGFLVFLNTIVELFSVGILIPMVSVLLKKENSYFFGINVYDYLNNFKFADPLILITIFVASVYLIKNLFIFYFIFAQGRFVRDVQFRSTKELYQNYLNQKYSFFLDTNTGLLIRNINSTGAISLCLLSYLTLVAEIILTVSMISYLLFLNFLPTFIPLVFFVIFFNNL